MLEKKRICIVGGGNMGEALLGGLIANEAAKAGNIVCTDIRKERLDKLQSEYGVGVTTDNPKAVGDSDIIIYAVKPQIIASVLRQTAIKLDMSKLVISVAAGIPLAALETCLNKKLRLVRAMPNIAAFVRESATAIARGADATDEDLQTAKQIFDSVGKTVIVQEKVIMDAVTGLSGSGPAYIFLIVDALADAGVKMGLARADALMLAGQTVLGAATLLLESRAHPIELKDRVTSPGGTSIAGLHALEKGGLRAALIDAVEAAAERSKELGEGVVKSFAES